MPDGRSPEGTTQTFALFGTQDQFCKPALNYEPTEGPKKPLKSPPVGAAAKDGHDPRKAPKPKEHCPRDSKGKQADGNARPGPLNH